MRKVLDGLYAGAGYLAGCFLVIVFLLMMFMSVGRSFALNLTDGTFIASWCMAALSSLGMAHTFKRGEMIRVGLLTERLKGGAKIAAELFALVLALAFLLYFNWQAFLFVRFSYTMHEMSDGVMPVPLWLPQLGFFAGLTILTIAVIDELVHVARGNPLSFEKPPPKTTEELLARVTEGGGV